MDSSGRDGTEAERDQEKPGRPFPRCCGGDFTPFGSEGEGGFPGRFRAGMGPTTSGKTEPRASCPMARMCEGMMGAGGRGLGLLLVIPAAVLLCLGAVILLAPQILSWLVAGGLMVVGGLILVAALIARRGAAAA